MVHTLKQKHGARCALVVEPAPPVCRGGTVRLPTSDCECPGCLVLWDVPRGKAAKAAKKRPNASAKPQCATSGRNETLIIPTYTGCVQRVHASNTQGGVIRRFM